MKQPKLWRRWFAKRTERIEITHETNTVVVMRASGMSTRVRCPECGSDIHSHKGASTETLICRASLPAQTGASELVEDELPARRVESNR